MYELSLTEHVMMSSDQRSSPCHPINLLGLHQSQLCCQHFAIFREDQLNFGFPVFPGGISNCSRFPGAVNTLCMQTVFQGEDVKLLVSAQPDSLLRHCIPLV